MRTRLIFWVVLLMGMLGQFLMAQSVPKPPIMRLVTDIALPNVKGEISHVAYDSTHHRMFISCPVNQTVEVVDLLQKKVVQTLRNVEEPLGMVYLPAQDQLLVANSHVGGCDVYNASTLERVSGLEIGPFPRDLYHDNGRNKLYVGSELKQIDVLDAQTFKRESTIPFADRAPSFFYSETLQKLFANVEGVNADIVVIDLTSGTVANTWDCKGYSGGYTIAVDAERQRLFIGFRVPHKVVVLDALTGEMKNELNIAAVVNDVFYDAVRKEVIAVCMQGQIHVYKQVNADVYRLLGMVETPRAVGGSLYVPALKQLFVTGLAYPDANAHLWVYER